ncbi:unnamed protein product [[Actinomadura] parvosata subsp. kistnae]|uniref:hypothetical protein n=1 Tax=[Actinomadura] parvosata TaxID=1955412 RepID=UPI000D2AD626|nr:unnamed protein product [Actinomadura parvosata subsp. kistnae]
MEQLTIAGLRGPEHGTTLASVLGRCGLDRGDAHMAAPADASVCPIVTLEAPIGRRRPARSTSGGTASRSPTRPVMRPI